MDPAAAEDEGDDGIGISVVVVDDVDVVESIALFPFLFRSHQQLDRVDEREDGVVRSLKPTRARTDESRGAQDGLCYERMHFFFSSVPFFFFA